MIHKIIYKYIDYFFYDILSKIYVSNIISQIVFYFNEQSIPRSAHLKDNFISIYLGLMLFYSLVLG